MQRTRHLTGRCADDTGATAVEYAIMVSIIAAVVVATVLTLSDQSLSAFQTISDQISPPATP